MKKELSQKLETGRSGLRIPDFHWNNPDEPYPIDAHKWLRGLFYANENEDGLLFVSGDDNHLHVMVSAHTDRSTRKTIEDSHGRGTAHVGSTSIFRVQFMSPDSTAPQSFLEVAFTPASQEGNINLYRMAQSNTTYRLRNETGDWDTISDDGLRGAHWHKSEEAQAEFASDRNMLKTSFEEFIDYLR